MTPDAQAVQRRVDGTRIDADLHEGGERGAIILHGLASERRALGPLPAELADRGFTVLAPDLRGHGTSEGQRGVVSRERVRADLDRWTEVLSDEGAGLDLLAGHSLGGLWSLYAAPELDARAVAVVASPASIRSQLNPLELVGYRVAGAADKLARALGASTLRAPYQVGVEDVLADPEAIERAREWELLQETVPLVNVDEFLAIDGPAWARRVEGPTLVAYAEDDELVDRESTRELYEALPGGRTWMGLPGPHSCFLDRAGEDCAEQVADWAAERLA